MVRKVGYGTIGNTGDIVSSITSFSISPVDPMKKASPNIIIMVS